MPLRLALPWKTIRYDAESAVKDVIVSHRVRRKVSGPLHRETVYGDTGKQINGMTRSSYRGVNQQSTPINDAASCNTTSVPPTPVRRDPIPQGNRTAEARGVGTVQPVRPLVCTEGGVPEASRRERFPLYPGTATVSAPFHCGAGSLAIRKIRKAAMAHSRRIRLLGATMICTSFTHSRREP